MISKRSTTFLCSVTNWSSTFKLNKSISVPFNIGVYFQNCFIWILRPSPVDFNHHCLSGLIVSFISSQKSSYSPPWSLKSYKIKKNPILNSEVVLMKSKITYGILNNTASNFGTVMLANLGKAINLTVTSDTEIL